MLKKMKLNGSMMYSWWWFPSRLACIGLYMPLDRPLPPWRADRFLFKPEQKVGPLKRGSPPPATSAPSSSDRFPRSRQSVHGASLGPGEARDFPSLSSLPGGRPSPSQVPSDSVTGTKLAFSDASPWVSSVQFSCSAVSESLRPHESQHARPPCPSSTPRVHSNSHPSSW